jgi:hydroxymethylpyrimidine pyrophosphatase-like HAD family hydrolase
MKSIYIDVDGTLYRHGQLNEHLLDYIIKARGEDAFIALWSARGQAYAEHFADSNNISHLFDVIIPKPTHVADDKSWIWTRHCKFISLF